MAKELSESQVLSRIENLVAKLPSVTARTRVLQYLKEKQWDLPQTVAKGTPVPGYLDTPRVTGLEGCVPHVPA